MMSDTHEAFDMLLPMYLTGQLDGADLIFVENQLAKSETCRAMLAAERQLMGDVATLPISIPYFPMPPLPKPARLSAMSRAWLSVKQTLSDLVAQPVRTATFAGVQAALIVTVFMFAQSLVAPDVEYKTLSSRNASQQANAIIMFKPDTREQEFREILASSQAVIVGGPTEAGAYLLRIPARHRDDVVALLSSKPQVTMAQPLGGE